MFSSTRGKLCFALSCLVLMSAFTSGAEAWYYNDSSTNDGSSEQRAYLINDIENFRLFRDRINSGLDEAGKYYRLTSNIDLRSDTDWDPIGYDENDATYILTSNTHVFNGHFDGDGHTVMVSIDKRGSNSASTSYNHGIYAGLFGVVGSMKMGNDIAYVRNLNVVGTVKSTVKANREHEAYAGGIAVAASYQSSIENCTFSGDVTAVNEDNNIVSSNGTVSLAGGIVAYTIDGSITSCEVKIGSIVSARDYKTYSAEYSTEIYSSFAGGIAAYALDSDELAECTSRARILNADVKGGIAGFARISAIQENKYSSALWGLGGYEGGGYAMIQSDYGCIYDPISITILTETLPAATAGQRYEATLEASEVKNIVWELARGTLPSGLTLSETGVLSGVPSSVSSSSFDIRVYVSSATNISDTATFSLSAGSTNTNPDTTPNNTPNNTPNTPQQGTTSGSSGGGGCSSAAGISAVMLCVWAIWKRR